MTSLFLLRHGQTHWNTERRFQGMKDSPLTEKGQEQARQHGWLLKHQEVSHAIASPLGRVRETIKIIQEIWDGSIKFDERLVELSAGRWEGLTYTEVKFQFPDECELFSRWSLDFKPPGGESKNEMRIRLLAVLKDLKKSPNDLAIISHGGVSRMLVELILGLPNEGEPTFHTGNEIVFRIDDPFGQCQCVHYGEGTVANEGLPLIRTEGK